MNSQQGESKDEKRRFSRVPFEARVLIKKGDKEWRSNLLDISLKGLLIESPKEWEATKGEHFYIEVLFEERGALITAYVRIAYNREGLTGCEITQLDLESVAHLRRLVELNLGNEELLDRELTALHWK